MILFKTVQYFYVIKYISSIIWFPFFRVYQKSCQPCKNVIQFCVSICELSNSSLSISINQSKIVEKVLSRGVVTLGTGTSAIGSTFSIFNDFQT